MGAVLVYRYTGEFLLFSYPYMELWRSSLLFRSFVYRYTRTQPEDAFLFFKVDFKVSNIANFSFQIWNFQDKWLKKGYLLADKIRNFSSISNKLSLDTTTISLVLLLSDFSLLNIDLLCLGIRPCWLRFMSTNFWTKKNLG